MQQLYKPLDRERKEIRLLIVQPGVDDEPLRGVLEAGFLAQDPRPRYETISYVWGNPWDRGQIILNGIELRVPASSERVLRRVRLCDHQRVVWIDAICINQDDLVERGHQVEMMAEIYRNTINGLIWLGTGDGSTDLALDAIEAILRDMRQETDNFSKTNELINSDGRLIWSQKPFSVQFSEKTLLTFFSSSWFFRLWVVQEAILAPSSTCLVGHRSVPLRDVARAVIWLGHKTLSLTELRRSNGFANAKMMCFWIDRELGTFARAASASPDSTMLILLYSLRSMAAYDARDHIFALLGCLDEFEADGDATRVLTPDYTTSTPELYVRATVYVLQKQQNCEVLKHVVHRSDSEYSDFPTWVPRWDRMLDGNQDPSEFRFVGQKADGRERMILQEPARDRILSLGGFSLGEVARHSSSIQQWTFESASAFLREAETMLLRTEPASEEGRKRLGMTLRAGVSADDVAADRSEGSVLYSRYKSFLERTGRLPVLNTTASQEEQTISLFEQAMVNACQRRKFFITTNGHAGIGPQTMQEKDRVVILYGLRWCAVLRPPQHNLNDHEFVGVCYVDGVMSGEATKAHRASGTVDQLFRIR